MDASSLKSLPKGTPISLGISTMISVAKRSLKIIESYWEDEVDLKSAEAMRKK